MQTSAFQLGLISALSLGLGLAVSSKAAIGYPTGAVSYGANATSWSMLGTNLSRKRADGGWDSDVDRLLLMDARDFNQLGLGLDELIEGYVQTVLAMNAIDRMCGSLVNAKGRFRRRLFSSLNPDPALAAELYQRAAESGP